MDAMPGGLVPAWNQKQVEGKMFQRLACVQCGTRFHFTDGPRVTRVPRCPVCGAMDTYSSIV